MAWLTVKLASGKERGHEVLDDVTFVGSAEDCQIHLRDPQAAPKHCQVLRSGANLKLLDLGSPAGTQVNGQPVKEKSLLDGDVIQIGATKIVFKAAGASGLAAAKTVVINAPGVAARPAVPARAPAPASARQAPAAAPAPAPVPVLAPRPSASRRSSRATAARSGRRGREREREEDGEDVEEDVGSRAERRFSRSSSGSSIWMKLGISAVTLGALIYLLLQAFNKDEEFDKLIAEGQRLAMVGNSDLALAKIDAAMKRTEPGTSDYASAKVIYDRIKGEASIAVRAKDEKSSYEYFESNCRPFYDMYIDSASKKFQGKDYLNDPVTARYFVEYRLKYYLRRFPEGKETGTVKAWMESLKRRYNEADPFPRPDQWWDTEVIATMESRLEHYGAAYKIRAQFKANNPTYKNMAKVDEEIGLERHRAEVNVNAYTAEIERALGAKSYGSAMGKAIKIRKQVDGMPDLVEKVKALGQKVADAAKAAGQTFDAATMAQLEGGSSDAGES